jgi:predicted RNA binding protein YcfA (HicA-like mRNA interferase family)
MGDKFPVITGKDLIDFLLKHGCELKRVKGSHHVLKSVYNNKIFVIPVHSNEDLDRGTLRSILRQVGIDVESFIDLWKER